MKNGIFKKAILLFALVACLLSQSAVFAVDYSVTMMDELLDLNFQSPLSSYAHVNSKWNQPRNIGTNPHRGVDLQADVNTTLYAVYDGFVEHMYGGGPNDIRFIIDQNGNKRKDSYETASVRFYHLNERVSEGYYKKGAIIGKTGDKEDVAPHLHFGVVDESNNVWARNTPCYDWRSEWDNGKCLDSYSDIHTSATNTVCITTYFFDENGRYEPEEVVLFRREAGTSHWDGPFNMIKVGDEYTYSFSRNIYDPGTDVEWTVRYKRPNLGSKYSYAWAPAKFSQPANDPNDSAEPYAYFTHTMR